MPADCDVPAAPRDDDSQFLGKTPITADHVQQAFREYLKDDKLTVVKADSKTIAAGQGFTSYIERVYLEWSDDDKKRHQSLPKSAILKALSKDALEVLLEKFNLEDDQGRKDLAFMLTNAHVTECSVYQMFGSTGPVPLPECYASWSGDDPTRPPLLLLEDLGDRARVLGDGSSSLSYEQLLNLAEAQAHMHAWSLSTNVQWQDNFVTFRERMEQFPSFDHMLKQGVQKAKASLKDTIVGKLSDEKVYALFSNEGMSKVLDVHKEWMPDVLIHGDFWANNIMFEKLPDGSMGPKLAAFIDWQVAIKGTPMLDMGRVLSMSFDADLREKHMEAIIRRYYDTLVKKLGDRMPKELTYDRVLQIANELTAFGYLMFLGMLDAISGLFAPDSDPDAEIKRARLSKRVVDGCEFASKILDIV